MSGKLAALSLALSLGALALAGYALTRSSAPRAPLGEVMRALSSHFSSLYYCGIHGNHGRARYETEAISAAIDEVEAAHVSKNGVPVSDIVRTMVGSHFQPLLSAIEQHDHDRFVSAYQTAVSVCNACHANAGVGFIRIVVPTAEPYPNQAWRLDGKTD
ncbi:MAG: hypothetical protein U1E76_04280 [Planctomycetota bacterium]